MTFTPVSGAAPSPAGYLRSLIADAIALGAPTACAGCSGPGPAVCLTCRDQLRVHPRPHMPNPRPARWSPLHVAADYEGVMRTIITAWKERGRRDLVGPLAEFLATAVCAALPAPVGAAAVSLVPIPASPSARRRRGEDAWRRVVRTTVHLLARRGYDVTLDCCLDLVRQPRDQAGLTAVERHANLRGAMRCSKPPVGLVIVVDDVVTTGATLVEAFRALLDGGASQVHAAAIAATPRHGRPLPAAPGAGGPAHW